MNINDTVLKNEERAVFELRSLYSRYGYSQYKMSKFEEYDLYVRNKDFLVSDNIITFTDTNGKLLALKPDVTLSIIKNCKDIPDFVQKLYYNENVYRVSKGTHAFKEIMQTGLECIGAIDDYDIGEVLRLAAMSLMSISEDFVLDISHIGIISSLLERLSVSSAAKAELMKCIAEKNIHGISAVCEREGAEGETCEILKRLVSCYGSVDAVLPKLKAMAAEIQNDEAIRQLENIISLLNGLPKDKICIDFSVINDMSYYNGIVFKGFINGISSGILSGGQYDKLMMKMGRKSGAIGFAVYLDLLERMTDDNDDFDVDTVVLYDESTDLEHIGSTVAKCADKNESVSAQRNIPEKLRYKNIIDLRREG